MTKVTSNQLTAVMLSINFNEKIKEFIASDQTFTFMNSIKSVEATCVEIATDMKRCFRLKNMLNFIVP